MQGVLGTVPEMRPRALRQSEDSVLTATPSAEDSRESREVSDGDGENPKQGGYRLRLQWTLAEGPRRGEGTACVLLWL